MTDVKPQRKQYESPRRSEQLDATRRRILEAARRLFRDKGYANTTMNEIARESGLAVPTVYKNFGNKRRLLLELIEQTIDSRVPAEFASVIQQTTPRARIAGLAAMAVHLASTAADVISIVMGASGADPQFAEMVRRISEGRRQNAARVARSLARERALRPEVSEEQARDVMYALASPEIYELLVTRSGWSDDQFETWLSSTLAGSLLGLVP